MDEKYMDAVLNIQTSAENSFSNYEYYHRYEPTPYSALHYLFEHYEINRKDRVVDFGCGKGRLVFYTNYFWQSFCTGIEVDEKLYQEALINKDRFCKKRKNSNHKLSFRCCLAEEYEIEPSDNIFYFFNPFSVKIFMKVVKRILDSLEEYPRHVDILLYYPHEDYIFFLERHTPFTLCKEIRIPELYHKDSNERFLIYRYS